MRGWGVGRMTGRRGKGDVERMREREREVRSMKMGEQRGGRYYRGRKKKGSDQRDGDSDRACTRREKRPAGTEQERDSQRTTPEDAVEDADLYQTRVGQRRKESDTSAHDAIHDR